MAKDHKKSPADRINELRHEERRLRHALQYEKNKFAVLAVASTIAAGIAGAAYCHSNTDDNAHNDWPKGAANGKSAEVVQSKPSTAFGRVLLASERHKEGRTSTFSSDILEPEAVTSRFLGGKLVHTFVEVSEKDKNLYHFSIIGNKSGYLQDGQKIAPSIKSAAEIAEILIDPSHKNPEQIAEWLTWLFKKNGWAELQYSGLKVEIDLKGKISVKVPEYTPETRILLEVASPIDPQGHIAPVNSQTKEKEIQSLADGSHNLLIPSGIAPIHDVIVPEEYLYRNPSFELPLGNGKKITVPIDSLDKSLQSYLKRRATDRKNIAVYGAKFGEIDIPLIANMIPTDDPVIDQITKSVVRENMSPAQKYVSIGQYIQRTTNYRPEFDADEDRPGLVTLFNGGSDCNNRTDLYAEMAYHAGLGTGIVHMVDTSPDEFIAHVRPALPAKYFPGLMTIDSEKKLVAYEMAGNFTVPGGEYFGPNFVVSHIETFPLPTKTQNKPESAK